MKKTSKILFLLVVSLFMMYTILTSKVNAAETTTIDYDGYTEIESSITTNTTNTTNNTNTSNTVNTTKTENTSNTTNTATKNEAEKSTATTSHPQAGNFDNVMFLAVAGTVLCVIVFAIVKVKKYNY